MTTPTTPLDLDALEKVAREATQGPWVQDSSPYGPMGTIWAGMTPSGNGNPGRLTANVVGDSAEAEANAAYLATFDPPTVLRLIETQRELVAALGALNEHLTIPAAEYVPAIPEAWKIIDTAIAKAEGRS